MSCECLNYEIVCSSGREGHNWLHDVRQLRARPAYTRETWTHTPILVKQTLEIQQKFDRLFARFKMLYSVSIPRGTADDEDIVGKVFSFTDGPRVEKIVNLRHCVNSSLWKVSLDPNCGWLLHWKPFLLLRTQTNQTTMFLFAPHRSFYKNVFVQGKPFEIISTANQ